MGRVTLFVAMFGCKNGGRKVFPKFEGQEVPNYFDPGLFRPNLAVGRGEARPWTPLLLAI